MNQLFSLDGSVPPLQTLPQLLLLTDVRSLVSIKIRDTYYCRDEIVSFVLNGN